MNEKLQMLIDSDNPVNWELAVILSVNSTKNELNELYNTLLYKDSKLHKDKWMNIFNSTGMMLQGGSSLAPSILTTLMDNVSNLITKRRLDG